MQKIISQKASLNRMIQDLSEIVFGDS